MRGRDLSKLEQLKLSKQYYVILNEVKDLLIKNVLNINRKNIFLEMGLYLMKTGFQAFQITLVKSENRRAKGDKSQQRPFPFPLSPLFCELAIIVPRQL